jgi:hypothetical protein
VADGFSNCIAGCWVLAAAIQREAPQVAEPLRRVAQVERSAAIESLAAHVFLPFHDLPGLNSARSSSGEVARNFSWSWINWLIRANFALELLGHGLTVSKAIARLSI